MSTADVGDAVELTFTTNPSADVAVTWLDPNGDLVLDAAVVTETPPGSGLYPVTFVLTAPGVWTARFVASGTATAVESYYLRAASIAGAAPLATVEEVATQFGSMTPAQETLTAALLRTASAMIRSRYPAVDTWIADGRINAELVALAAINMVLRVLRNPSGLRAETIGPFSRTYDTKYAAGLLVLGEDETGLLTPPVTVSTAASPVGTIFLRPGLAPPPYGIRRGWL